MTDIAVVDDPTFELTDRYAGWVQYHARFKVSDEEREVVFDYLDTHGHCEGEENFEIWYDMLFAGRNDDSKPWQHNWVALGYMGGDWEGDDEEAEEGEEIPPGPAYFYLKRDETLGLFIHVPTSLGYDKKQWANIVHRCFRESSLMNPIISHVEKILRDKSEWTQLHVERW